MTDHSALSLIDVNKSFGGRAVLKGVNLDVPFESVFAFLGNNGEGKSTTIKILTGLLAPQKGNVIICGKPLYLPQTTRWSWAGKTRPNFSVLSEVGALIDSPSLYPNLTAQEFLYIGCKVKGIPTLEISRVLDVVSLQDAAKHVISQFSLGMKQRLAIAHALLGSPRLMVLDEPTNGLDPRGIRDIRALLSSLPYTTGTTVFFSSHNLDEVEKVATQFAVLRDGKIRFASDIQTWKRSVQVNMVVELAKPKQANTLLREHGFESAVIDEQKIQVRHLMRSEQPALHTLLIQSGFEMYQSYYQQLSLEQWFTNEKSF